MEKHYYIGEGSQAEELIAETLERENVAREARKTLMVEYEADGLVLSVWDHGKVAGLAFDKPTSRPYLKRETELSNGKGYGYYPKLNTKEGKRLSQKLEAKELTFSLSDFILDKLHLHRTVAGPNSLSRTGCALYRSAAGIISGKVLVSIPGSKDREHGGDPFPEVPAWFREVKESEWLAAQGR